MLAAPPPTLLLITKAPQPGRSKTRLTPAFTPEQAADLAGAALADTLAALALVPAGRRLLVLDGEPGRWLPPGWEVLPQCEGGLDRRIAAAFAHAARLAPHAPALLVGSDTPQLDPAALAAPLSAAERPGADAWFGPAEDGGFWALGLARPDARLAERLLHGVPMSTADTGRRVRERLAAHGLAVRELPALLDVDGPDDAARVAALAPGTRFAARLREYAPVPGPAR
ncbi:TIGR04282 family arsenosugar biosynthesis glycosyltransferase [Kitasatospora sp. NPDC004272]